MNVSTLTTSTFTLTTNTTSVSGVVSDTGRIAFFSPSSDLAASTLYTATITTDAKDTAGVGLASNYVWSFTTGSGVTAVKNGVVPQEFALFQNYPNPFNPSTKIEYSLQRESQVSLKIYNVLGSEVATLVNGRQEAGRYVVPFTAIGGNRLTSASGVYFYRLVANAIPLGDAGSFVSTKKLILLK
jgi:hypothetical protein